MIHIIGIGGSCGAFTLPERAAASGMLEAPYCIQEAIMGTIETMEALDAAERVCARRGVRLTSLRRRILEQILNTDGVIKAYDLIHELSSADRSIKPPTVYRSLAFLLEQGFIHRIESLNGFVACNHPGEEAHETLLMICDTC
jgi:Fur family zinc uptake transcriptional regulator